MPKLKIEMALGNAALHRSPEPDDGTEGPIDGRAVADILRDLADGMADDGDLHAGVGGTLQDANGQRVGAWLVTE